MSEIQLLVRQCLDAHYARCPKLLPGVPPEMLASGADPDSDWQPWKLLPSPVTASDLDALDAQLPAPLPSTFRAYLSTYCLLDMEIGQYKLPAMPSDGPLRFAKWRLMHREMWPAGFMEFAGTVDGDPVCFDIDAVGSADDYPIVAINHDAMTSDGWTVRTTVLENCRPVAKNFLEFLVMLCRPGQSGDRRKQQ